MLNATQTRTYRLADLRLALGFQDVIWLSGRVFLFRDFVEQAETVGLATVLANCPYGDLAQDQMATFADAFHNARLRGIVAQWWAAFDLARERGEIPHLNQPGLRQAGPSQDLARLAGLTFLRRGFVVEADALGLDTLFAHECAYGDLTKDEAAAFKAAFRQPHLRAIVGRWWQAYDEERALGMISAANYWG